MSFLRPARRGPTTFWWDASIDLTAANTVLGERPPRRLLRDVHDAVRGLPGARLVSVEEHHCAPEHLPWLTLYRGGSARRLEGDDWAQLRARVEAAVHRGLGEWSAIAFAASC